jgi:two-component system cell cycle sensor histidine kinase/response regulator CckA
VTGEGRILVVDDSEESLKLLSGMLTAEGYDVRPADSGELALAAVTLSPPEVVLLDMRMPGMSGLDVCRELKSRAESRDIPVIFLSASFDFEDRIEGLEAGAVDFLNKPFRREELLARLKTHLELARLHKDLERRVAERTAQLRAVNEQLNVELEARKRTEDELRESERRFWSLADTTPAGICVFTREGSLLYASQWLLTFVGTTMEDLAENGLLRFVHPEESALLGVQIAAAVDERRTIQVEHRLLRSDGEYRWVAVSATPRYLHGEFVGHTMILLDVTELKRSQEQALANQKLESLGALTSGIAHNFNNALSTILAHTELVADEVPSGSPAYESVTSIATVALRASEVVRLLMVYAGDADFGSLELVDLSSLIADTVRLLQSSVARTTTLEVKLSKDLHPIWANAGQVRHVVLNLIMNASEALEGKAGTVTVSTTRTRVDRGAEGPGSAGLGSGDYVLLAVSDSGCGMTEEVQSRIFDPFFSTKFLGRGLGLASVQGILRGAGGTISVVSTPGGGSTFKVWWPYSEGVPKMAGASVGVGQSTGGTVLLVDDEDGLRRAAAGALKKTGFTVLEAQDGLEAVRLFTEHADEIDIVVLDLSLPGLSGKDAGDEIGRVKKEVPMLFCSAHDLAGRQVPQPFLQKPYRLSELVQVVQEMVGSRSLESDAHVNQPCDPKPKK